MTVTVKGIAPTFSSAAAATFSTGQTDEFTITTNGSPAAAITRLSGALPEGVTLHDNGDGTATLSGTPDLTTAPVGGSQNYEFTLRASNVEGQAGQSFSLTVEHPARIPSITSTGRIAVEVGKAVDFTVTTTGEPTPELSLFSGDLPAGLSFHVNGDGTATLSGTPAVGAAPTNGHVEYELQVNALNSAGSVTESLVVNVYGPSGPRTPVVPETTPPSSPTPPTGGETPSTTAPKPTLSRNVVTLRAGRTGRQVVKVKAAAGSRVTCSGHLPAGLRCRVGKGTLVIESRPTLRRAGRFRLRVKIVGPTGTVTRSLLVKVAFS